VQSLFSISPVRARWRDEERHSTSSKQKQNKIKDFAFNPQTLTVKSGEKVTWINRDEEPHTIVSVEKQFKKSTALDTIKNSPLRREPRHLQLFLLRSSEDDRDDRGREIVRRHWCPV